MLLFPLFTHWLVFCFCSEMKINTHKGYFSGMGFVVKQTGLNTAGENTSGGWRGLHLLTPNSLHPTCPWPQTQQFCPKASPWTMSLISWPPLSLSQHQFSPFHPSDSVPHPKQTPWLLAGIKPWQKGKGKVREASRWGKCCTRKGQIKLSCLLEESYSSPDKWRAFP